MTTSRCINHSQPGRWLEVTEIRSRSRTRPSISRTSRGRWPRQFCWRSASPAQSPPSTSEWRAPRAGCCGLRRASDHWCDDASTSSPRPCAVPWQQFTVTACTLRWAGCMNIHTYTCLTAFFSGTTQVSWYRKGKTNLDFTEARDSEWQRHQLGHTQVCPSLQTDNHANAPNAHHSVFLQAGCPFYRPTDSVKAQN